MIDTNGKKLIIFDADGTLRRCTVPGQPCPNKDGEWELILGVREKIASLPDGLVFGIVSNQGGVGLGIMVEDVALGMLKSLAEVVFTLVRPTNVPIVVLMCPHAPKAGCACRKPSPLMLFRAMGEVGALPAETLHVGDMASDREAAQRAGVDFMWAWEFFGWAPVEGQGPGGTLQPEKAVSVTLKWDLGEGNEEAIFIRPRRDLLEALKKLRQVVEGGGL